MQTRPLVRAIIWRGLIIGVQYDKGQERAGVDQGGNAWTHTLTLPYGEIIGTRGVDGDPVDCFVNEAGLGSDRVFVVHTVVPGTDRYDEDKAMIGFPDKAAALVAFGEQYAEAWRVLGAVTTLSAEEFVRRCLSEDEQGKGFSRDTDARVKLGQRRILKARAEAEDRKAWMQAVVAKAQAVRSVAKGLTPQEIEDKIGELSAALDSEDAEAEVVDYQLALLRYAQAANTPRDVNKAVEMPGDGEDLYVRIWPGFNAVDLQNELIPVDLIYKSWAYYEACGNIDLEHISKTGGRGWREKAAKIEAAGFDPELGIKMRIQYEIGRPVPGSRRIENVDDEGNVTDFSFVARIHGGDNEAAAWFRSTLPHIPWKPSIGGQMSVPIKVWHRHHDPLTGVHEPRVQEIAVARDFRWNNTALSLEVQNSHCRRIEILSGEELEDAKKLAEGMGIKNGG